VITAVGVVVPAANEQEALGACVDSLVAARRHLQRAALRPPAVRVVIVLDSCIDGTAEVAAGYRDVEVVETSAQRVGVARAAGVSYLLRTSAAATREIWLANTDADSVVPPDWLSVAIEEADRGADLLVGTVQPGPGLSLQMERAWQRQHVQRRDHPHVHGANLGIRADAYLALGGWPSVATGEDVLLVRRTMHAGHLQVVRTPAIPVRTSTRRHGRAPRGFSSYLRGLDARGTDKVSVAAGSGADRVGSQAAGFLGATHLHPPVDHPDLEHGLRSGRRS
jgi:hypothetical protein